MLRTSETSPSLEVELPLRNLFANLRRRDRRSLKQASEILSTLHASLLGLLSVLLDEVFRLGWGDKNIWRRKKKSFLGRIRTVVDKAYDDLAKIGFDIQKEAFYDAYKNLLEPFKGFGKEVKDIKLPKLKFAEPKVLDLYKNKVAKAELEEGFYAAILEASPVKLKIGVGKVSKDFLKFLSDQFDQELFPEKAIKSLSPEHISFVQGVMLAGISKGLDLGWQKDKIMQYIGRNLSSDKRRELEYKVMRILRTSHQRAANAATSLFAARNKHIISGLIRRANGRPCLACLVLDGKEYPVGSVLDDHPNGMCVFVPKLKSLEELGLDYDKLPPEAKKVWKGVGAPRPLSSKFYELPEVEQRRIFANDKLYNLWLKEKFPIEKLAVYKDGSWVTMSYKDAIKKLPDLGGISYPKVRFVRLEPLDVNDYVTEHLKAVASRRIPKHLKKYDSTYTLKELNLTDAVGIVKPVTRYGDVDIIGGLARRGFTGHDLTIVVRTDREVRDLRNILARCRNETINRNVRFEAYIKAKDGYFVYDGEFRHILPSEYIAKVEENSLWSLRVPRLSYREYSGVEKLKFNSAIDPRDRLEEGYVAVRLSPDQVRLLNQKYKTSFGQDLFGLGTDVPEKLSKKAKFEIKYSDRFLWGKDLDQANWYDWNTRARYLGLARRKATDGSWYYIVPEDMLDDIYRTISTTIEVRIPKDLREYEAIVNRFLSSKVQ
ncbi:MAG: hypothetical protein ACTSVF_03585 [Candidatus Asgardarchaeia archaeon]